MWSRMSLSKLDRCGDQTLAEYFAAALREEG